MTYREELGVGLPQNQLLSDLILENYVWKQFIRDRLAQGEIPLWNPYILAGQPFLANGQHSAYYPFSILFYILPLDKAYGWFTVSQLWLAGLSMYIFLRVLGVGRFSALFSGITYSLSAFFLVRIVFTMVLAAAVWLPVLLSIIEIIIRKQEQKGLTVYSPIPYVIAGAVTLGIQTLAGHVEITYYTLLVSGFYAFFRLLILWYNQRTAQFMVRMGVWLLLLVVLGVGLGAIQLIPMYEVVSQNFRDDSVSLAQVRDWALPIRRIATFILPDFFGSPAHHGYFDVVTRQWQPLGLNAHGEINPLCPNCTSWDIKTAVEAGAYLGILSLIFAMLAVVQAIQQTLKVSKTFRVLYPVFIFSLLAILSLLFAFGSPLYALLFYGLPGWNQLHSPFRWIFPYTLSMSVLAGLGMHALTELVSSRWGKDEANKHPFTLAPPSFLGSFSLYLGWLLFWSGLVGMVIMLTALVWPNPFIQTASAVFDRSGLAQNAFADGRQFFGYQWPNLFRFSLMVMASGAILRITRCPIFIRLKFRGEFWPIPTWQILAVIIISLDLFMAGYGFNPANDPTLLEFKPPVITWLENQQEHDPFFRLTSFDTPTGRGNKIFLANSGMRSNLFDVRGYDSIIPGQYGQFMQLIQPNGDLLFNRVGPIYHDGYNALDSALLDLLGVRYVLTTEDISNPNYQLVYEDEIRVYENQDALPRAFIVTEAIDLSGTSWEEMSFALRSLNPRQQLILDGENNGRGSAIGSSQSVIENRKSKIENPIITDYRPIEIKLTANLEAEGWLVLADSYFPGWRAFVKQAGVDEDETELTIHRADGNFRAVNLPAGAWEVRFRYSPRSFQLGVYSSFLALVTLALLGGYWSWGKLYRESDDDSAIKRIAKNSLVPMVMALSNRVIDFAFAMLMLRILAPEGAGRYAFAVAFIGLTEILTRYGLGTLVTRDVAADRQQSNRYLANVTILRLYLWLVALPFMGTVLAMYLLFGSLTWDVVVTVAIFSIGTLFSNFSDGLTAVFYAHEKAEYPAAIASVTTLTRVSLGALVLLLGWGIIGLAVASVAANLVAFSMLSYILVTKLFRPQAESDSGLQREMMGESLPLMINHLLSTIFFRIDVFILSPTWGDNAVGYYNAAYKYIDGINVIPQYFTLAIFPLMSKFATDSRESLVRAYLLSLRLLLLLAIPLAVGTPFIAYEMILFLAGEKFIPDSVIVLQLLIWFLPFSFINQVTQYVLIAINQQRALTRAFIIGVLFNTITNLIFIPMYGYQAAAVTTILSEWSLLIPFYILVRRHLCHVPWFDIVWRPTISAMIMGLVLWSIGDLNVIATISLGGLVYLICLTLVGGFRQPDMAVLWRAVRR
ncbi:oligosaccharide flippase family protein [Anaerolineales bacterium HSG6]|nr:oligosaccharide flippase family protein [Anaerolineales bacterium HSG6]